MRPRSFFGRRFWCSVSRSAGALLAVLVAVACGSPALCDEIHEAAKNGDLAKVQALLKSNPDLVSSKDGLGMTPLHWAASKGHKDVAEFLLANSAEVDAKDKAGTTPLWLAARDGHKNVLELLLAHGADVNVHALDSSTPLLEAAHFHEDVAKVLIINKADVNVKTAAGLTPLHQAALGGHGDLAELMLR